MNVHDAVRYEISPEVVSQSRKYKDALKEEKVDEWSLVSEVQLLVKSSEILSKGLFIWFSTRPYEYSLRVDIQKKNKESTCRLCSYKTLSTSRFKVLNLNNKASVAFKEIDIHYMEKHKLFFDDPQKLCKVFDYIGLFCSDSSSEEEENES